MLQKIGEFFGSLVPSGGEAAVMSIGAGIGAAASYALGGFDDACLWLFAFVCADYVTGVIAAVKNEGLSSKHGFVGIFRKCCIFAIVSLCHGLDVVLGLEIIRDAAIAAYVLNEATSIAENLDRAGMGEIIPAPIRKLVATIKAKEAEKLGQKEEEIR